MAARSTSVVRTPLARAGAYVFVEDDASAPSAAESKAPVLGPRPAQTPVPRSGGTLRDSVLPPSVADYSLLTAGASLSSFPGAMMMRTSMKREMSFKIGASYQVATTAAGLGPNTSVSNDLLSGLSDFTSLAAIFDEFFITSFRMVYQPVDRYEKQAVTFNVDYPLHIASIQHGAPLYATHTNAANNAALLVCNTADPWTYVWKNTENKKAGSLPDPSSSSVTSTQGWCLTSPDNAASYTGAAQIIAPSAYTGGAISNPTGTVTVVWSVAFRCRK